MKVYIEYILIDNIVMNFIILFLTAKVLRVKFRAWRLILASVAGAGAVIGFSFITISNLLQVFLKLILGLVLIMIAFGLGRIKDYLAQYFGFISFTFLIGGAALAIVLIFGRVDFSGGVEGYDASLPLGLMMLIAFVTALIVISLSRLIYQRRDCKQFIAKITLSIGGKTRELVGFIDSGNRLFDHVTGLPVIIISASALKSMISEDVLSRAILGTQTKDKINGAHFITLETLSGRAKPMLVISPDAVTMEFGGRVVKSRVMVGITNGHFKDAVAYDAILHPSMLV